MLLFVCKNAELVAKITQLHQMSHDETATPSFYRLGGDHTSEFNV
jgi:hypothetical protein